MIPDATAIANGATLVTAGATNFPVVVAVFAIAIVVTVTVFVYRRVTAGMPRR